MIKRNLVIAVLFLMSIVLSPATANLLVNGDFETGNYNNWTVWKATWGGGNQTAVQSSVKYQGNYALNLSIPSNSTSFGVYQQVQVVPGTKYKVTGYWKGSYTPTTSNWFEVLLLDGAFSLYGADDPNGVKPNFLSVYDPAYRVFNWEPISTAYATTTFIQNGERTATQSVMTVVLKVGGFGNPTGYFDDIRMEVVPEPSSLVVLAGGIGALAGFIRRRKI